MSVHPNDIAHRSRVARLGLAALILSLIAAFFNAQVLQHDRYKLQSQENRLRALPLPAPLQATSSTIDGRSRRTPRTISTLTSLSSA